MWHKIQWKRPRTCILNCTTSTWSRCETHWGRKLSLLSLKPLPESTHIPIGASNLLSGNKQAVRLLGLSQQQSPPGSQGQLGAEMGQEKGDSRGSKARESASYGLMPGTATSTLPAYTRSLVSAEPKIILFPGRAWKSAPTGLPIISSGRTNCSC